MVSLAPELNSPELVTALLAIFDYHVLYCLTDHIGWCCCGEGVHSQNNMPENVDNVFHLQFHVIT